MKKRFSISRWIFLVLAVLTNSFVVAYSCLPASITDKWNDGVFSLHCNTNLHGSSIDDIVGYVDLSNLSMIGGNVKEGAMPENLYVQNIHISSTLNNNSERQITLEGDDAKLLVKGDFTPSQLQNTIIGLVHAQWTALSVNTANQS